MTDTPKTPYQPPPKSNRTAAAVNQCREAKEWTRKLGEAGKLSGRPAQPIPHYGRTDKVEIPQ